MGKTIINLFNFVYKIIRFIILTPIKIIKYACMGFYFVCYMLIELLIGIIVLISFLFYKLVKYFILFFTFPIVIYNSLTRNKKSTKKVLEKNKSHNEISIPEKISDETLTIPNINEESNNSEDEEIITIPDEEPIQSTDTVDNQDSTDSNEEIITIPNEQPIETINNQDLISSNEIIESIPTKKEKKKKDYKALKRILLVIQYISFPIYKLAKYLLLGFSWIMIALYKLFTILSFVVYKLVKYLLLSLTIPLFISNIIRRRNSTSEKIQLREELKLRRQEEKFKRQLLIQNRQEEKLRKELAKKQKNGEYINEKVKIDKKSFSQNLNEFLNSLFSFPSRAVAGIKKSIQNSVFVKDAKNKKDINRQALLINFEGEDAEKSDVKLVYEYTAKNKDGKVVTDYFEAFSKVEVHSFLLSEGFEVYNIKTSKWIQFAHKSSASSKVKIKNKDLIFFLTQLSTYIKAGIPLVEALKILARQYTKKKNYQRVFRTIIYDLTMGENFSTALSKQGNAFPKILINMIKSSEMTGELPEVLDDMANYFDEMEKTRKQMVTALMYPMIVLVISVAVITFILLFVIPKFVTIYETMDATKIPAFTLFVLSVSDFLKKYIFLLLGIIVLFVGVMVYLYKNVKVFRTLLQWIAMHLPVFGDVIIYNEVAIFTKTFASLLSHNVFITDSMEILTKVTDNEIYKMLILDTITNLAKGEKISTSFKDHWAFPIPAYEMLVTGEKTGQLAEMMAKVADYYQELHKNSVTRIKTFIEPILIIFLTVVVGAIVLSIVIPMFSMYQSIQDYGQQ